MSRLFIKFAHSFVAIELLNFCKNAKNYFIAQESSRYSVRKQDWFFLLFVHIKTFRKKIGFCIWMKITMTDIIKRERTLFYIHEIAKRFNIQKARHFYKS